MNGRGITKERRGAIAAWMALTLFLLAFAYCIPKTSDDWYYYMPGDCASVLRSAFDTALSFWQSTNGRLLGNFFTTLLSSTRVFRVLYWAAAMAWLLYLLGGLSGREKGARIWPYLAAFTLLFASPKAWFSGNIAWMPAFCNYITPIVLTLSYLTCMRGLFAGAAVKDTAGGAALCFALGLAGQFFNEAFAIYRLLMATALLLWHLLQCRKLSIKALLFLLGAAAGTAILLRSPAYHAVAAADGETYQRMANSVSGMVSMAVENYRYVAAYTVGCNLVPVYCVSVLGILIVSGATDAKKPRWLSGALIAVLSASPIYFYFTTQDMGALLPLSALFQSNALAMLLDALVYAAYTLAVIAVLCRYVREPFYRNVGCFCMLSTLACAAPLLFAQPLAHRIFAGGYVFLCLLTLVMLQYALSLFPKMRRTLSIAISSLAIAIAVLYLCMFASNPKVEREKQAFIEWRMTYGETTIYTPDFLYGQRLWYPESELWATYYYERRGDIQFEHIPYDMWRERYYSRP